MRYLALYMVIITSVLTWTAPAVGQAEQPLDDYFVEASVSNPMPYVGEQIIYIFTYYAFFLPEQFPYEFPDFEGFWLSRQIEANDLQVETINNRQYYVGQAIAEITPLEPGFITIAPTHFIIDESVFRAGVEIQSEPVTVEVQPLPDNAPAAFNGSVGQFNISTTLTPAEAALGTPLTYTMTVEGNGNLELVSPPDLSMLDGWRVYASPARYTASVLGGGFGQKTFSWTVLPDETGTQIFPGAAFVYFDPRADQYQVIPAEPITVDIFPGTDALTRPRVDSRIQDTAPVALRDVNLSAGSGRVSNLIWFLWGIPPLATAGFALWVLSRSRQRQHRREQRQSLALRQALKRLDDVASEQVEQDLEYVLYRYIADKLLVPTQVLRTRGLDRDVLPISDGAWEDLTAYLSQAEGMRYIPDGVDKYPIQQKLVQHAAEVLKRIEREWGRVK